MSMVQWFLQHGWAPITLYVTITLLNFYNRTVIMILIKKKFNFKMDMNSFLWSFYKKRVAHFLLCTFSSVYVSFCGYVSFWVCFLLCTFPSVYVCLCRKNFRKILSPVLYDRWHVILSPVTSVGIQEVLISSVHF